MIHIMSSPLIAYVSHVGTCVALVALAYAFRERLLGQARIIFKQDDGQASGDAAWRERRDALLIGGVAAGAVLIVITFIGLPIPVALVFSTVFGLFAPWIAQKRRRELHVKQFEAAMAEALQTVASSLKAGLTLKDSLTVATESAAPAFAEEIALALKEYRFGVSIEEALDNVRRRLPTPNTNIAFGAMIIGSRLGGRLPDILREIVATIRERDRVEGKLKALTAQGRAQSAILMAAPPLMGIGLYLYDPTKMQLLTDYWPGQILLTIAIVLELIGIAVTRRMMKLEV